jgi:hypothetical protein
MFANWMQIQMGKILKTIQVYHNDFIYVYLYTILFKFYIFETCWKFGSWFQFLHHSKI